MGPLPGGVVDDGARQVMIAKESTSMFEQTVVSLPSAPAEEAKPMENAMDIRAIPRQISPPEDVESFLGRLGQVLGLQR